MKTYLSQFRPPGGDIIIAQMSDMLSKQNDDVVGRVGLIG